MTRRVNSCLGCGAPLPRAVHAQVAYSHRNGNSFRPRYCHACFTRISENLTPKGIARLRRRAFVVVRSGSRCDGVTW